MRHTAFRREKHAVMLLVTGGAGFRGSHLCEALLARGQRVTILNTFSVTAKQNLAEVVPSDRADVVFGSVSDWQLVSKTARDHDVIFQLAANVNLDQSLSDPRSFVGTVSRSGSRVNSTSEPSYRCASDP